MSDKYDFRIIVIDDNPEIHNDLIRVLTNYEKPNELSSMEHVLFSQEENRKDLLPEFLIDTASQGKEGVEKIKKAIDENKPYALAFVDIRMPPGWDGIETIKHIWELDRNIQIVICTAYSDYTWEETVEKLGNTDNLLILKKPFDFIAVRQLACALTKKWQLFQETIRHTRSLEESIKERTESLQQSLSRLKATLESSTDGILVIDNDGNIMDHNKKFTAMWNLVKTGLKGKNFSELVNYMAEKIEGKEKFLNTVHEFNTNYEKINLDKLILNNGKIFEYYSQPQKLNKSIIGRVYSFRDITQRSKLESELQRQATHDSLTGLPNRVLLEEFIRSAIQSSMHDDVIFAILFFDLDRFKLINDSLSHAMGDKLLCVIAKRIQSVLREGDFVARLGGDEFVIVLENIDKNTVKNIARKLLDQINQPLHIAKREIIITASVGISFFPQDGENVDMLLSNADAAMYKAKKSGADRYYFYTSDLSYENLEFLDKEMQLRQAIANNELFVSYQPQIDLKTKKLIAVEALVRWLHPTKGLLLPIDFIPLAEATGLIVPIGEWVLRTACKQNKQWMDAGLGPLRVAVNITTHQLNQYNLIETIKSILDETGMGPQYLELELTENAIISNTNVINTINAIKNLGVSIALDDFGTGYSSLNYLKDIHLDRLKIDRSFVQNILINRGDEVIIQAIITMAHSLNLEVLAEGVETRQQLDYLSKQHCGGIQGFYFSKPLSGAELEKMLLNSKDVLDLLKKEKI